MSEELDLIDLLYEFWKKKLWIIIAVIIGVIVGFAYTRYIVDPKYTSSATLILARHSNDIVDGTTANGTITQSDIALNEKLISTYGEVMKSRRVCNTVIEELDLKMTYEKLIKCISVTAVKDADIIRLSITTEDSELSAKIANEMTKVFIQEVAKIYNIKNISVLDDAKENTKPVNVNYIKNIVIFAVVFSAFVFAFIFMIYYFDNTIKTEDNIGKVTGLPVLCTIPNLKTLKSKGGSKGAQR